MKPISIQLYTVREAAKNDFFGVLGQIARIGYKGVEPAGLHGKAPKEVRKVLDDLGLVCSSTHGPLATKDNLSEQVDLARTLGYSMLISGVGPDDFKTLEGIQKAAQKFQAAAELLEPHGLRMGYHNHWWEMDNVDGRAGYDLFFERARGVFSELDVYWASHFGAVDVPSLLKRHNRNVPLLHIKDGPLVKDKPHTAVGKGKLNIPAIVAAADASTLQWLVVELDDCATDMMQAVMDSYDYLTGNGLAQGKTSA